MNRYPHPDSAPMRAVEHIRKHGAARSADLAQIMGVPAADVTNHLKGAVRDGLLVTCKVETHTQGGVRHQNEYRLGAGGKPRPWRDFSISGKPAAPRGTRPNAADHMAAAADARDAAPPPKTAQAAAATAAAADKPGESAPNIPGSVPAELAAPLSRGAPSAAGHATPPPPAPQAAPTASGAGQGAPDEFSPAMQAEAALRPPSFEVSADLADALVRRAHSLAAGAAPNYSMDDTLCLTIAAGDEHIVLQQPQASRLFRYLCRFGDVL